MTAAAQAEQVGYIEAEFETLVTPQGYTGRDGKPKTAHNIALFVEGQGGGQVYVDAETYQQAQRQGLKRGDRIALSFNLALYQGKLTPRISGITKL